MTEALSGRSAPHSPDPIPHVLDLVLKVAGSLELDAALQAITQAAVAIAGGTTSCIYLRDEDGRFHAVAAQGLPLERLQEVVLEPTEGLIAEMCRTQGPVQAIDFPEQVRTSSRATQEAVRVGTHGTLGVPFVVGGQCIGALYVGKPEPSLYPEPTVAILERFAAIATAAIYNLRRFSTVERERTRLQLFLDAIPEAIMAFDREGRITMINAAMEREMGATQSVVGLPRDEVIRARSRYGSRPVRLRYDPVAITQGVLKTGESAQGLLEMDNPPQTWEVYFSPLRSTTGEVEGIVSTMRDLTAPLELERERSRSNIMRQLLDLSVQLNSDLSVAALLERVVEAAIQLVGARSGTVGMLERDEIVFRRFRRADAGWIDIDHHFRRGEGVTGWVWETMAPYVSNHAATDPHVRRALQQEYAFTRLVSVPMVNGEGALLGTLEVHDPIVERQFGQADVEALQLLVHQAAIAIENARLSEMKDEFLSIVSHELKTPVTSIKGFAQLLGRRLSPESLQKGGRYIEIITQQSDRLVDLINHLLDLSRIQTGRFTFDLTEMNYGGLVHDVVTEERLVHAGHEIALDAPSDLLLRGNADRLRQVLVNLIDNAARYGPANGAIHIGVEERDGDVITCVTDEGPGLPADEGERIFQLYYQVRQAGSSQGLGLGLFISRQIVEEHGGAIWLVPGDHTSFCFSIPHGTDADGSADRAASEQRRGG